MMLIELVMLHTKFHFHKIELVFPFVDAISKLKYFTTYKAILGPNLSSTV